MKEHEYIGHKSVCPKCMTVDIDKPATLANCCHQFAPVLRDYLNHIATPAYKAQQKALKRQFTVDPVDGKSYKTTKKKLAEEMRYKDDCCEI